MQRKLAYALSPAPQLPLRFMLSAPWFALLAALVLLAGGAPAFASRWSTPLLAATHLLTLGYLSMAMIGSMLQLIPVVAGIELILRRSTVHVTWGALILGTLMLATALGLNLSTLFVPTALVLAAAFAPLLASLVRALAHAAPPKALPMLRGMRIALGGLLVTFALGFTLTTGFGGLLTVPLPLLADLHAAWGLLGWVAMLVLCVAFQVIPMFQSSRLYPAPVARWSAVVLCAALLAWSVVRIVAPERADIAAAVLAAILCAWAALSAWLLARPQRKVVDATTLYWRLALASLAAGALLSLLPASETLSLLTGIVFVAGFAMGVVNGMLYKIVPFLLWYHLQDHPRARKGEVPALREIVADGDARRQFWWHAAAFAALLGATFYPEPLARPAAALLAIASVLLGRDLARAARRCGALERAFQPS